MSASRKAAPEWQCPSCGMAYYKSVKKKADNNGISLGTWLMVAALLYGAWTEGVQLAKQGHRGDVENMSSAAARA